MCRVKVVVVLLSECSRSYCDVAIVYVPAVACQDLSALG